jgi:hypothetical protein
MEARRVTEPTKLIAARGLAAELETSYHRLSRWLRRQRDVGVGGREFGRELVGLGAG